MLEYTESDLDTTFIGLWHLFQIDDYKSVKSGTESIVTVVRSKVIPEQNI